MNFLIKFMQNFLYLKVIEYIIDSLDMKIPEFYLDLKKKYKIPQFQFNFDRFEVSTENEFGKFIK